MDDISLFDAIRKQRGIKRFRPDPVPQEAVERILKAAIRAPSAGNRQPWVFMIVRDEAIRAQLGRWYLESLQRTVVQDPEAARRRPPPEESAKTITEAPVIIVPCMRRRPGAPPPAGLMPGASIYPAVQNLLLAAQALGLGTTITSVQAGIEPQVRALMGIPDDVDPAAVVPLGYPAEGQHFGGSRRKPITEVTFYDRWGNADSGSAEL